MEVNRPDPNALLEAITEDGSSDQKERGKLKIFLGAAPGVGKTYAMLEAGHNALKSNIKILVGVIETHGRSETEKLLENLPLAPLKEITYNSKVFKELDLDAIIRLKPQLVLVDELPHRNIPGCANTMRYQDIVNLLDAGIDVYTTVNVQHLESLNDEIYKTTKVRVKSTVPDSIFEMANETVVIDITPEELIERLKQGKVYIPDRANRALDNFFSKSNISILRAMAMQVAAKSISRKVVSYKQIHGIVEPWAVAEKVLVCITDSSFTPSLIRSSKRIAVNSNAELIAIYVESPLIKLSEEKKKVISNHKRYAEYLGAEAITVSSQNIAKGIIKYALANNITHIVLSKAVKSRFGEFIMGSVVSDVIRHSGKMNIHVLNERPMSDSTSPLTRWMKRFFVDIGIFQLKNFCYSLIFSVLMFIIGLILKYYTSIGDGSTIILLFLLPAIFSAFRYGFTISLATNVVNILAFAFIFEAPYFTFDVTKSRTILPLFIFLCVSFIISRLTYVLREQVRTITKREKTTSDIFKFSRKILQEDELDTLMSTALFNINKIFDMDAAIFLPLSNNDEQINMVSSCPENAVLDVKDNAALLWAWKYKAISGIGTSTLSSSSWFFYPLKTAENHIGIIGIKVKSDSDFFDVETNDFFQSLAEQLAMSISRIQLLTFKLSTQNLEQSKI